ncbi:MAG TPA: DUF4007 family protein [Parafilimonas sp.]|nr:DUF4007 family protein [Parafilimonas sp.]
MEKIGSAIKFTFSGHDSFQCRQLWLKKGFDFIQEKQAFYNEDAVVKLGVGKNMVSAIRYWMKAFNIIDSKDKPTAFGIKLFDNENGYDPFLEDEASLWLLHYQLIKTGLASMYSIIFNEFRKEKLFFNKDTFLNYLKRRRDAEPSLIFNDNTVADDFIVFVKMYQSSGASKDVEDSFSGILSEIELLKTIGKGKEEQYQIENNDRDKLPHAVLLFSILDNHNYGNSISLNSLEFDHNSPGSIFALNRSGLTNKISEIVSENKNIIFTDHAGIKELQFKNKLNAYSILDTYYGS